MITLQVTSDSSVPELRIAERFISDIISLRVDKDMKKPTLSEIAEHFKIPPVVDEIHDVVLATFNATELAEAETMGKPVCSTVVADPSTIAHADTQVNTSLPAPTSVFGQHAQTTANVANPAVHLTPDPVVDGEGLLWDKRIHSSSRELNKDGTWRKRRGVSDALVAEVERELHGTPKFEHKSPTTDEGLTLAVEQPTMVEVKLPDVGTIAPLTFTELLDGVTKAMVSGQLSQDKINEALATIGLTALPHLLGNPALIPAFREALGGVV